MLKLHKAFNWYLKVKVLIAVNVNSILKVEIEEIIEQLEKL